MRGKIGLVVGLGVGYVLGTRAGRERYEQIKTQWLKLWHREPVQERVSQVKDFARSTAMAVPSALWSGTVRVARAAMDAEPKHRQEAVIDAAGDATSDLADALEETADAVRENLTGHGKSQDKD